MCWDSSFKSGKNDELSTQAHQTNLESQDERILDDQIKFLSSKSTHSVLSCGTEDSDTCEN